MSNTQIAKVKYLHIAPRKVRLVANTLKGLSAHEAEAQLLLRPHRAAKALLTLLRSGVANAKNNKKLNAEKLVVSNLMVDPGPMMKRFMPRAMGRATPIQKKMSHVTLVLEESNKITTRRFTINPPVKKDKKPAKATKAKTTPKPQADIKEIPKKERPGFFKKIFQRKSV
ncbi:MAG: 50S ribosomal protein L22 [bacterium]|nr:50S ribosomal protein L22 [bacterium]